MGAERGSILRALHIMAGDDISAVELPMRICRAYVTGTDVDGAAISVLTTSVHRQTLAATDTTATVLEDLQYTLGEGACIDAAVSRRPVLVPDIHDHAQAARWPMFAAGVAEQTGARALFALPLQLGTINLGVLDLYRHAPGPLRDGTLGDAVRATETVALLLLESRLGAEIRESADGSADLLRTVPARVGDESPQRGGLFDDRAEVHQATGMVLVQLGIPAEDAFVRLRAYAFVHRRPLGEVAHDVVTRRLVFTPDMD